MLGCGRRIANGVSDSDLVTSTFGLDAGQYGELVLKVPRVKVAEHGKHETELVLCVERVEVGGKEFVDGAVRRGRGR